MSNHRHNYKDVEKTTGLEPHYVRRLMKSAPSVREKHTAKGSSGAILFDDNAIILFQRVAEMRSKGNSTKTIASYLEQELAPQTKTSSTPDVSEPKPLTEIMFKALQEAHKETVNELKQRIMLLTDGRDPAEVRREREQEQARLMQLERDKSEAEQRAKQAQSEAENAALTARDLMRAATAKEQALEQEQARLKRELESKQAESQAQEQAARERATKRAVLLDQLDQLSWFQPGRKRDLLTQIRELD